VETLVKYINIPLSVEELKEFIENKDKEQNYVIKYSTSQLKGFVFINYLSNLELPAEVDFSESSIDDRNELISAYFSSKNNLKVDSLRLNAAMVLLEFRGIDTKEIVLNPIFSNEELKQFIELEKEVISKWENFVESTTIFAQLSSPELSKQIDIKSQVPSIEDSQYIGANIVNLFSIPSFVELFFFAPIRTELTDFKHQFEDYMFKGKSLYHYYFVPENTVATMFFAHLENEVMKVDINTAVNEAAEFLK
jgi:hypothetical protein